MVISIVLYVYILTLKDFSKRIAKRYVASLPSVTRKYGEARRFLVDLKQTRDM